MRHFEPTVDVNPIKYMPFVRVCFFFLFSLLLVKLFSIVYLYIVATICGE